MQQIPMDKDFLAEIEQAVKSGESKVPRGTININVDIVADPPATRAEQLIIVRVVSLLLSYLRRNRQRG